MPVPYPDEKESNFIGRCIPFVIKEGTATDNKQAAAICYSIWKRHKLSDSQHLSEAKCGVHLPQEQARMVWQHNTTMIADAKEYKDHIGVPLYLIGGNDCYGIIQLEDAEMVDLVKFKELEDKHKITDNMREQAWQGKQKLFVYPFKEICLYDAPRLVKIPESDTIFVENIDFLESIQNSSLLTQDIALYSPEGIPLEQLESDFRISLALYCTKRSGGEIEHTLEEIEHIVQLTMQELIKRGGIDFHPEKMEPFAKEAFERVFAKIKEPIKAETKIELEKPLFHKYFEDAVLVKDVISLTGLSIENEQCNNIDLVITLKQSPDYIKKAIETRIVKMMPEKYADKINFMWKGTEELNDKFLPVYDLVLRRRDSAIMEQENTSIKLMEPFIPMKPKRRFSNTNAVLDYIYGDL